MKTVNQITLMGYISGEPVEKVFDSATCVFVTLKTRDFFQKNGESKVDKNYHSLVLWNGVSRGAIDILKDGDVIWAQGRLKNRRLEGPDGKPFYKTEVVVEDWTKISNSENTDE